VRDVALKIIPHGELTSFDRFRQEALALSRLKSRHIARVHDFGRDEELGYYLAMELIDGVPLESAALGRPLLPHEVLRAARGLLAALAEAHDAGIVHRDIKPSNVLVPGGIAGLHDVRLLDFGIARSERRAQVREGLGELDTRDGVVVGTPAYLAPELVAAGRATPATDVYATGLVLFDLLGKGPLFPGETFSDQLAGRLRQDPELQGRVDEPVAHLFERMLARAPEARFQHAREALTFITELETAPVAAEDLARETKKKSVPPPISTSLPPRSVPAPRSVPPPRSEGVDSVRPSRPPGGFFGTRRLARADDQPLAALLECLHALDLSMLDALARRERGSAWGGIATAIACALRLDFRGAASTLETISSPEARAVGAALVAPRAARAIAAKVDDRDDAWVDTIDPELAAVLSAIALALTTQENARRSSDRCRRCQERLSAQLDGGRAWEAVPDLTGVHGTGGRRAATRTTLAMADWCGRALIGDVTIARAREECASLRDGEALPLSPLQHFIRAILVAFANASADQHMTREQLERASRLAIESGATLLELRAIVSWGGLLLEIPGRIEQGMAVLDRASALLHGADAPSLLYMAEHNRGAALLIQGRYAEAAPHPRRARQAAEGELSLDHELLSTNNEAYALLALGDREGTAALMPLLAEDRVAQARPRTQMHVRCTRSLVALMNGNGARAEAELGLNGDRRPDLEASCDGYLFAESLGIIYAWARGEQTTFLARAAELEKVAQDRGITSFYFLRMLDTIASHIRDEKLRARVRDACGRLELLLNPQAERGTGT
jgi:serine/threonine-protein kinase